MNWKHVAMIIISTIIGMNGENLKQMNWNASCSNHWIIRFDLHLMRVFVCLLVCLFVGVHSAFFHISTVDTVPKSSYSERHLVRTTNKPGSKKVIKLWLCEYIEFVLYIWVSHQNEWWKGAVEGIVSVGVTAIIIYVSLALSLSLFFSLSLTHNHRCTLFL